MPRLVRATVVHNEGKDQLTLYGLFLKLLPPYPHHTKYQLIIFEACMFYPITLFFSLQFFATFLRTAVFNLTILVSMVSSHKTTYAAYFSHRHTFDPIKNQDLLHKYMTIHVLPSENAQNSFLSG